MNDSPRLYRFVSKRYRDEHLFLITPEAIFCSDRDIFYDACSNCDEQNTFLNLNNTLVFGIKNQNKFWNY